jgi:hypothetical protein
MTYIKGGPTIQGLSAEDINEAVHKAHQFPQLKDTDTLVETTASVAYDATELQDVMNKLNSLIAKLTVV